MKRISAAISIIISALMLVSALPAYAFLQEDEAQSRVIFYNISGEYGSAWSGDCIFVQSGDSWGMIDSGHRFADTISDSNGAVYNLSQSSGLCGTVEYKNGRDAVKYMMESFGLTHLDFVLVTHAHSDHIGGIPEIAELQYTDESGNSHYIIDENTVYFYKNYYHINNLEDDLLHYSSSSWHNQAFVYEATQAMLERGAVMVEVSKGGFVGQPNRMEQAFAADLERINATPALSAAYYSSGYARDYYDDVLSFKMGDLQISLYNLLAHNSKYSDNPNSIAAVITNGKQKIVTMADLDFGDEAEQKTAAAIFNDFGTADLLKAMHHGTHKWSNNFETLDYLRPKSIAVTRRNQQIYGSNVSGAFSLATAYARDNFGTAFYEVGASGFGFVATFGEDKLQYNAISGVGAEAQLVDADCCLSRLYPHEGWNKLETDYNGNGVYYYIKDSRIATGWICSGGWWYYMGSDGVMQSSRWLSYGGDWYYLTEDGSARVGWLKYNDNWYYFDENGTMCTGWAQADGEWHYFNSDGVMQYDWQKIGGAWYYLDHGKMQKGWAEINGKWYYFSAEGKMQTGWQCIKDKWYCFSKSGVMQTGWHNTGGRWYYLGSGGSMCKGWQSIGGKWYYFNEVGVMQTGVQMINGRIYNFASSGEWVK